jgi:hypothetical protein
MKTFQEWWSQDQCNEDRTSGRLLVLSRVIDGLKKGFGTDNIKELEGNTFTDENLRAPLPETGEPHQGQGAGLDDQTIKAAKELGILVKGDHGHWKLVAAEDWRVRGSNYEQPFGFPTRKGEDDHLSNDPDDWHNDAPPYGRPHDLRTPSGISVKDGTDTFGRRRRYPYGFDGYDAAEDRSRAERDRTQGHK